METKTLTFPLPEILEQVNLRLEYIAAKRATSPEDFFRHSVCEADHPVLKDLARKAFLWLSSRLGILSVGADWSDDTFNLILLYPSGKIGESTWRLIRETLRFVVADRIIRLWLDLTGQPSPSPTGSADLDALLADSDDALSLLADTLAPLTGRRSPLAPRPMMPI